MSLSESQASRKRPQTEVITIASHIQSTLISNCLTEARWYEHVSACLTYHFQAAMIAAAWVRKTAELLRGTGIKVASFIDLPYGTMTGAGKAYEARRLIDEGAEEIDLMPNVSFLLSGMEKEYFEDIRGVVEAAGAIPVKIMLELPLLNAQQRARAVALSIDAGVAYLKNASGGAVGVATPEDIRYLRRLAPSRVHIKASGGVKTAQHVKDLLEAGADLVGTSAAVDIIKEL
jgi:deoxyribose-phosphate aldolase